MSFRLDKEKAWFTLDRTCAGYVPIRRVCPLGDGEPPVSKFLPDRFRYKVVPITEDHFPSRPTVPCSILPQHRLPVGNPSIAGGDSHIGKADQSRQTPGDRSLVAVHEQHAARLATLVVIELLVPTLTFNAHATLPKRRLSSSASLHVRGVRQGVLCIAVRGGQSHHCPRLRVVDSPCLRTRMTGGAIACQNRLLVGQGDSHILPTQR